MAEVVGVLGVTHNPLVWQSLQESVPEDLEVVAANFERLRSLVSAWSPDLIVMVASDHLHMLMMSNMPAFMIGKAPEMRAGHPNEARAFGLESRTVPGAHALGAHLLGGRDLSTDFDFSFSDEPWLDHSFLVPLLFLTPKLDLPIVPVFTNCNAPPIPTAARFGELGSYLAEKIASFPGEQRVLVVGSGHLAHELGGPRQFLGESPDPEFDEMAVGWMATGDVDSAMAATGFERLTEAGNESYQFLNFITSMTVAQGAAASFAEGTPTRFGNLPFFVWEPG
jgi:protocatechuate 4,5-dioxygenase beta chain